MTHTLVCPACFGTHAVAAYNVTLFLCTDDPALSYLLFPCRLCGEQKRLVSKLEADCYIGDAVIVVHRWSKLDPTPCEPPPLTWDDVLDAHGVDWDAAWAEVAS